MLKRFGLIIAALIVLVAAGCSGDKENSQQSLPIPRMIDVELSLPETAEPGENVRIAAWVTLEGENVENADEVVFEIWKHGQREHAEKTHGTHVGDGVYVMERTFDEDGVYYVISHVTVEEMHNMPRKRIIVGEVDPQELEEEEPHHDTMEEHEHHGHH